MLVPQHIFSYLLSYMNTYVNVGVDFPGGSNGKESTCNVGDLGSIPGLGKPPREGNSCPL